MIKQFILLALLAVTAHAQPERFEAPSCEAPNQLARRTAFTLCFNPETKVAAWASYELSPEHLTASAFPRPSHFRRDPDLESASDSDYRGTGMQRGHLVPAQDVSWSEEAIRDSFLLSNAAPQFPAVNQSAIRRLENAIRREASGQPLHIITGTLYDCGTVITYIGRNNVAVPCAFYKVVAGESRIEATLVSNQTNPVAEPIAITKLEQRTGLKFVHVAAEQETPASIPPRTAAP